ncbi:creatininase family protein [Candidatus Bathyarchaeota archaeon]|nr:creatininase family protein [Candidatus Bathyarchaeota archaeon]
MENLLFKLTRPEVEEYLNHDDVVLVPIGSTEQHGKHMAIDNDAYTAFEISRRVAERTGVLVAPTLSYGFSPHHMNFKGSVTLTFGTLVNVIKEVCESLLHHGFEKIVVMNAHGGNTNPITQALREIQEETGKRVYSLMVFPGASGFGSDAVSVIKQKGGGHACELETSVGMALKQRLLMDKAENWKPEYSSIDPKYRGKVSAAYMFDEVTSIGSLGDPTNATLEKGETLVEAAVRDISEFIEDLKKNQPYASSVV